VKKLLGRRLRLPPTLACQGLGSEAVDESYDDLAEAQDCGGEEVRHWSSPFINEKTEGMVTHFSSDVKVVSAVCGILPTEVGRYRIDLHPTGANRI
jgi:hypothetical protein